MRGEIRGLLDPEKGWERTTVLTLIRRLVKKKVIRQEKREVYYYFPCMKREDYVRAQTESFVDKFLREAPGTWRRPLSAARR